MQTAVATEVAASSFREQLSKLTFRRTETSRDYISTLASILYFTASINQHNSLPKCQEEKLRDLPMVVRFFASLEVQMQVSC
jgi:hypothetical protein